MSKEAKNLLSPPDAKDEQNASKRKMTQAILEDQEKEKEVFEFLEDDDDFEEFENDELDYDQLVNMGGDVEMSDANNKNEKQGGEDFDRKLWQVFSF